jgi:DNA mismatch repair ATPase MutL
MFGDKLEKIEMQKILDDLKNTKFKWLCAHGRPNYWFIPFTEINKKFHR